MTADSMPQALPVNRRYQELDETELGFKIGSNIEFVVENSLCHGCGTCEAACPKDAIKVSYEDLRGIHLPQVDPDSCDDCGVCVQTCPGFELDLAEKPEAQVPLDAHPWVGSYDAIYRCYSTNDERRLRAASGGILTEVLSYLLDNDLIDGAIVTRMSAANPLRAEGYIARSPEELIASQKSKYCPAPLNTILKDLVREKSTDRYAFVGLPGHVHGLRLLQRAYPHLNESVQYVLSSFTAHVPSQHATEFILYKNGIRSEDVETIEYRGGGNPGRMRIVTTDGAEHFVPHFHWTYSGHAFPMFFYPVREWLYFDKMSEWADISVGDNWMHGLEEQAGASTAVVRSKHAHALIKKMVAEEKIVTTPMTADDLVVDQALRTKLNIYWRLKIWKKLGRQIPLYTREFEVLKGQRIKTLRFALFVMLSERSVPFWWMDKIIRADYYLRAVPKRFFKKLFRAVSRGFSMIMPASDKAPTRERKYKIAMIGGYGYYDIGDEAMPHAIRNRLREKLGDRLELVMLSYDPDCTTEMHGEKSVPDFTYISHRSGSSILRKLVTFGMTCLLFTSVYLQKWFDVRLALWPSARAALDAINTSDLVFNVGGGNINTVIPSELYKKTTTYIIARILGKPVYLSGQTMGPYSGWFAQQYTRFALQSVKMISFRDKDVSHNRVAEIGVTEPVQFDAADDAISLKGIDDATATTLLEKETGKSMRELKEKMLVVFNMKASLSIFKGQGRSGDLGNEVALMAQIADAMIEKFDCTVILMPTDFSDGVDDRVPHAQIYDLAKNKDSIYQVTEQYVDDELIGMIGLVDMAFGARYHFNVFAASRFIPFLGIASGVYQRTKLSGLASLCGLVECYVDHDMEYATLDDVWPSVEKVVQERDRIHAELRERVPGLKERSTSVADAAVLRLTSGED